MDFVKISSVLVSLFCLLQVCHAQDQTYYFVKRTGDDVTLVGNIPQNIINYATWLKDSETMYYGAPLADNNGFHDDYNDRTKYTVDREDNRFDLTIMNLQMSDAATYRVDALGEVSVTYKLVVIEDLICDPSGASSSTMDVGDELEFQCSMNYAGPIAPRLTWYSRNLSSRTRLDGDENDMENSVVNDYTVTATAEHHAQVHECQVSFSDDESMAQGIIPDDSCTSMFRVNHPVMELTFFEDRNYTRELGNGVSYDIGDAIYVKIDGSGDNTEIKWYCNGDDEADVTGEGVRLEISRNLYRGANSMNRCIVTAMNDLNSDPARADFEFYINNPDDKKPEAKTSGTNGGAIAAAIIIPLLIIAIVVVIGGWFILKNGGIIAAAIIVPLVVLAIIVVVGVFIIRKRRAAKSSLPSETTAPAEKTPYENKNFQGSEGDMKSPPANNGQANSQPAPPQRGINPNSTPYGGMTEQGYPGRGSPGFADLGVKHLSGSVPGLNESLESLPDPTRGPPVSADPRGGFDNRGSDTQV